LTTVLVIIGIAFPALVLLGLFAFVRMLAAGEVPDDVSSNRGRARSQSLFGRLRAWLNSTPKKLDYRRDKKGRFRRIRRG
jgi:hypothetical protein